MKKIIFICGLISGLIAGGVLLITMVLWKDNPNAEPSMAIGFASMILAFSLIFVGIKNYRDNLLGGTISFWKAFLTGSYIALIGSTIYVLVWLVCLYTMVPDFTDRYTEIVLRAAQKDGITGAEYQAKVEEMQSFKKLYSNPLVVFLFTYVEILPLGLLISVIAAAILRRKRAETPENLQTS